MTNDQRENRIKELFNDALELDEGERIAFLDSASDEESIRIDVRLMIEAHERAGDFLADPEIDGAERTGTIIGRYRLHSLIGEGGFGRVYRAEQFEPVTRDVALKIIKLGMDTRTVIERFEAERQALAKMDHPNIASVFDAGATTTGRPYFVMELVHGVPITDYCNQHRLSIVNRIELFRQVCSAVQHAHAKGVIHRDIKPSNVLVSNDHDDTAQCPKVIDFGVAKSISTKSTDKAAFTEVRHLIGTPEYMSPEQADVNATDIDTRSDIYSLGVLFYELLTGATPFDGERLRSSTFVELQRIIREEEPLKPSTKLSSLVALPKIAAQRAIEPGKLVSQLQGDLDWITLKALEKNRERRYGSASELAEDIRRHLADEPVLAGPPGAAYRVRKFIRRHRIGVLAACLVAFAVVSGAIGTTIGMLQARDSARQANDSAQQASAVNEFMREVLTSANPDQRGADVRLVEVLSSASATASLRFAGHPLLEAQVRDLLGSVYDRLTISNLAENEFRKALSLWQSCGNPDDPRVLKSLLSLGQSLVNQERGGEAEQLLRGILPRLDRAFGPDHETSFEGRSIVGAMLNVRGRFDESERLLRPTLERAAVVGMPEVIQLRLLNTLTGALWHKIKTIDPSQRNAAIEECRASATQLLERGIRKGAEGAWFVYTARNNLADLAMLREDFAEAAAQSRKSLEESRNQLSECHNTRVYAMSTLADAEGKLGETHEPADLYLRLIACIRATSNANSLRLLAFLSDALAPLDQDRRWSDGEACAREIMQILQGTGAGHVDAYIYELYLAHFISQQGRLDEAESLFQSLVTRGADTVSSHDRAYLDFQYASHLIKRGQFEHAEQLLKKLEATGELEIGAVAQVPDYLTAEFIALYEAWDKPDEAEKYRRVRDAADH